MTKTKHDFNHALKLYLISNGSTGRRQAEIVKHFHHRPKEEVLLELNALWAEELVQRFTLGPREKDIVWRAVDILNDLV